MSLMLNALKRIEAKKASVRTAASAAAAPAEPPPEELVDDSFHRCAVAGEDELVESAAAVAIAALPSSEAIDVPRELNADHVQELTADEVALPGAVSLETAMDEISDLLAEARLLERPLAGCADGVADEFKLELIEHSGADESHEPEAEETPAEGSSADNAATTPVINRPDFCELPQHDVCIAGGPDYETGYPLGAVEVFAAAAPAPEMIRTSLDSIHAALAQSPGEAIAPEAPEVVAEPMTIDPLGSDPYAAAAWQVLQQIPEGGSQVLLFTSPGDGHGKTTTLARLLPHVARSFSGSVLVVDANGRNPEMARRLEVAATWRLPDVLAGATHWMNAVRPTALPRVSLLPGGTETLRRANANGMAELLRELAGHYDLVLVDATSLAHDGAAQLAAACDGTCLVVRLGEVNRRIVRDVVRVLSRSGGRLLGCIAIDTGV